MESINFNKKFILIILLMGIIFCIFLSTNVNAVNYDFEYRMALENIDFYDDSGNKLGIVINQGEYLYVRPELYGKTINNQFFVQTLFQANTVYIKENDLSFNNSTQVYITKETTNLYDLGGNVIGKIDKNVEVDVANRKENGFYNVSIDGYILASNLQPDPGQVGDLGQEGGEDPVRVDEGGNVITVITKGLLKLLFETLPKMLVNLFNNINL
ncbi:MAG: hypothetical protein E7310_03765 [Clostridiales bacterium]|nr:hypothetical protein [Clostridiales bacterium]